jgi:tRNA nucleotidyltransferase (CCA-adding enzyme)
MILKLPDSVSEILKKFSKHDFEIYIVGGAVRDLIMGKIPKDWDFTTNATPEEILKIIPGSLYNNLYGTVFTDNPDDTQNPHEITTFRKEEGYSDARHPDKVSWGKTLQDDLGRRDFTINALALEQKDTKFDVRDFYNGQADIENKLIRAVREPNERFAEDALRMMRAVRLAAELGFTIEEKTFIAIKQNAALIHKIAKERIKEELFKILLSPHPYEGMMIFKNSGLLNEIIPELEKCFGVEQKSPGRHHIYDVGTHLFMSLKKCPSVDVITRFAALIHDIGKPQTYKKLPTGTITFYNHEMVSTKIAINLADRLRFSKKEKDKLVTLVRWHQFSVGEMQTDSAIRRFIRNVGKEFIDDMIDLRVSDRLGSGSRETSWRLEDFKKRILEVQKQPFSIRDLKINGMDVMKELGLKPGPQIGKILEEIFKEVENKELENKREALIERLKTITP